MRIREGVQMKKLGGNYMLRQLEENGKNKLLCALNETGAFLWNGLEQGMDEEELWKSLRDEYDAEPEDEEAMKDDINDFLTQLRRLEIII